MKNFLLCLVVLAFATLIGVAVQDSQNRPAQGARKPPASLQMPSVTKPFVTWNHFQRIQAGMTYKQVVDIIGVEGEELSRGRIDLAPGQPIETVMYQWMNRNASNMNAMFQNDRLITKSQFGLK